MSPFSLCLLFLLALLSAPETMAADQTLPAPPWTGKVPDRETHPCLFFGPADVPRLKERITREPYKRGLLLWDGEAWQVAPTADGT